MHRAKWRDRAHEASMPSPGTPLFPNFHELIHLEAPQTPILLSFYGGFVTKAQLMK